MQHKKAKAELYDLELDPEERENVIKRFPRVQADLQGKITAIVTKGRTTEGARQSNDTGYWDDLAWIAPEDYSK